MRPYIIPETETMSLHGRYAVLDSSEIPVGGGTDEFDTRVQNSWTDDWGDEDNR